MFGRNCVEKTCLGNAYNRHLERWPSANKKYERWKAESGAASSVSPPQSAGLSSAASSMSSKKRKRTEMKSKPSRLTSHQVEAQQVVDLKDESAKTELFCKITNFLHEKRKKGRYSTSKALDVFSAEMKEAGVVINSHTLDWRMRNGYVDVAAPKPGPASVVPAVSVHFACHPPNASKEWQFPDPHEKNPCRSHFTRVGSSFHKTVLAKCEGAP